MLGNHAELVPVTCIKKKEERERERERERETRMLNLMSKAPFRSKNFWILATVALSFVFDN